MARIGRLNKRVTFQSESRVPDGAGGNSVSWANGVTVWGAFHPERGRERLQGGRLEASLAGILVVRSSNDTRSITERDVVTVDGIRYAIKSISNPDQRNHMLEMMVERGTGEAAG